MTDPRDYIQFGPYLIVRLSGAGGMGRVEVALRADGEDPEVCVIKRLHGALHDEEQEARFRREASDRFTAGAREHRAHAADREDRR